MRSGVSPANTYFGKMFFKFFSPAPKFRSSFGVVL